MLPCVCEYFVVWLVLVCLSVPVGFILHFYMTPLIPHSVNKPENTAAAKTIHLNVKPCEASCLMHIHTVVILCVFLWLCSWWGLCSWVWACGWGSAIAPELSLKLKTSTQVHSLLVSTYVTWFHQNKHIVCLKHIYSQIFIYFFKRWLSWLPRALWCWSSSCLETTAPAARNDALCK